MDLKSKAGERQSLRNSSAPRSPATQRFTDPLETLSPGNHATKKFLSHLASCYLNSSVAALLHSYPRRTTNHHD
jgi:hypothetical protein